MPVGMLTPLPAGLDAARGLEAGSPAPTGERLALGRTAGGEGVELQPARTSDDPTRRTFERGQPGSRFLSVDAMTLLHDAFARALPGFDLFVPRFLGPPALARLRAELAAAKQALVDVGTLEAARTRWGSVAVIAALPDDAAWLHARGTLARTVDELVNFAEDLEKKGQGLWVLGS
jgi:hypothetical protein